MNKSRQEIAFNDWKDTFQKLVLSDKKLSPEVKRDIQAGIEDMMSYPGIFENMIQAFSNFMWGMDRRIEFEVAQELAMVIQVIAVTKAGLSDDGKAIVQTILDVIESNDTQLTEIEDDEIDSLVDDSEVDDSKPF